MVFLESLSPTAMYGGFATTKSMGELGAKMEAAEKKSIEDAIAALRDVLKSDDKGAIEAKTNALAEASSKMAERVYAQKEEANAAKNS